LHLHQQQLLLLLLLLLLLPHQLELGQFAASYSYSFQLLRGGSFKHN